MTNQYSASPSQKQLTKDYVDLSLTLIDNGDDKLCVEIPIGQRRILNVASEGLYMPKEVKSTMMIGMVGEGRIREIGCKMGGRSEGFQMGIVDTGRCP